MATGSLYAQQATPVVAPPTPEATEISTGSTPEPVSTAPQEITETPVVTPEAGLNDTPATPDANVGGANIQSNTDMAPLAAVDGTTIYTQNVDPLTCNPNSGWQFSFETITLAPGYVTVLFSNGEYLSVPLGAFGQTGPWTVTISENTQYMVENAWAFLDQPGAIGTLTLIEGPCNLPIYPDDTYEATFDFDTTDYMDPVGVEWVLTDSGETIVASGTLDSQGVAQVGNLPNGEYTIEVTDPSKAYESITETFTIMDQDVSFTYFLELRRGLTQTNFSLSRFDSGQNIVGAEITITNKDGAVLWTGYTDDNGHTEYILLPHGTFTFSATSPGYYPQTTMFTVVQSPALGISMQMHADTGITMSGIVADKTTMETITGATITVEGTNYTDTTDDDGNYSVFTGGPTWRATISAPGYHSITTYAFTPYQDQQSKVFNALLEPISPKTITLNVTTADNGSAANAIVTVGTQSYGTVGAGGSVTIHSLEVGESYAVTVDGTSDGYTPVTQNFTVTASQDTWEIELQPQQQQTQSITLRVDTSDNGSAAGALVFLDNDYVGTVGSDGTILLGELEIGFEYPVIVDGSAIGYPELGAEFRVVSGEGTWTMTLQKPTQDVTLNVQRTDSGSVGGFFYNVSSETAPGGTSGIIQSGNHVELGELPIDATYTVFINGTNQGFEQKTVEFTVEEGQDVWNITLAPLPPPSQQMTLQVTTSDSGSPADATFTVMRGQNEVATGTFDVTGLADLGELVIGESYDVSINGAPAGYGPESTIFTVTEGQGTWEVTLDPLPPATQGIALQATTSDSGSPADATFTVMQGQNEVATGTFDATGLADLGELVIGESYDVSINGAPAGYGSESTTFTVTEGQGTWEVTLDPLPPATQGITLQISTNDGGSPGGATFTLTEVPTTISGVSITATGPAVYQVAPAPITGIVPADGVIDVGLLRVGAAYIVDIQGTEAGYQDFTGTFQVEAGVGSWPILLQAVQVETTPTPSPTAEPTVVPTASVTPSPTSEPTIVPTATASAEPTVAPTIPATPAETAPPTDPPAEAPVTGLPSTGSGSGSMTNALLLVLTGILIAMVIGMRMKSGTTRR